MKDRYQNDNDVTGELNMMDDEDDDGVLFDDFTAMAQAKHLSGKKRPMGIEELDTEKCDDDGKGKMNLDELGKEMDTENSIRQQTIDGIQLDEDDDGEERQYTDRDLVYKNSA